MFSAIGRADKFNNENGREREEKKKDYSFHCRKY